MLSEAVSLLEANCSINIHIQFTTIDCVPVLPTCFLLPHSNSVGWKSQIMKCIID